MVFLGSVKHPYVQLSSPDRQKGLNQRFYKDEVFKGWLRMGGWVGLQKLITDLDMRNGHKGGLQV